MYYRIFVSVDFDITAKTVVISGLTITKTVTLDHPQCMLLTSCINGSTFFFTYKQHVYINMNSLVFQPMKCVNCFFPIKCSLINRKPSSEMGSTHHPSHFKLHIKCFVCKRCTGAPTISCKVDWWFDFLCFTDILW